jgi:S-adenosylhomocysteine hydrolase
MALEAPNITELPTPKLPEVASTPEQIQEKILQEVLEKYGVDLKEYTYDQTKF